MKQIIMAIIGILTCFASCAQNKTSDKEIDMKYLFSKWYPFERRYMTVYGLDDNGESNMSMTAYFDSTKASLLTTDTFFKPKYTIEKVPTQKKLEEDYDFQWTAFDIKTDSIFAITIYSNEAKRDTSGRKRTESETLYYDGKIMYINRDGVIFLLGKKPKAVRRSSQ